MEREWGKLEVTETWHPCAARPLPPFIPGPCTLGSALPWHPGPTGFTWLKFQPAVGEEAGADTLHFPISGNKSCGATYCQVEKKTHCKTVCERTTASRCAAASGRENSRERRAGNKGPFLRLWRGFVEPRGGFGIRRAVKVFYKKGKRSEKICWDMETEKQRFCCLVFGGCFPVF